MFISLIAILSQISIPLPSGVPITLQTFAISLCGFILGKKNSVIAIIVYILSGTFGFPVFTGFKSGLSVIAGLTGGFITGFVFLAYFCGKACEIKNRVFSLIICFTGLFLVHICGIIWFSLITENSFYNSFFIVSLPYILKDMVSVILAMTFSNILKKRIHFNIS